NGADPNVDKKGRIRIDDLEMKEEIQQKVALLWNEINTDNLLSVSDIEGYREDFFKLFGFGLPGVDYEADVNPDVQLVK
ncbi:MAG TPA: bifunctional NADH-specific enoyl-ACP reductase/trans-2-enoyl-CoA reductase, partial [Bacilli bacterium]